MNPSSNSKGRVLPTITIAVVALFIVGWILGRWGPELIANEKCFRFLGCNIGFFGYDAALHFVSGIMDLLVIVWLARRFLRFDLFGNVAWKNILIGVSMVALIAVVWEIGELCHDQFRMKVLHENLISPNHLDQPTNDDTMGDITFTLIGATLTACALEIIARQKKG
jgi:hypothetical protein